MDPKWVQSVCACGFLARPRAPSDGAPTPRGWGGEGRGAARRAPSVAPRHRRAYGVRAARAGAVRAGDGGGGVGHSAPAAREVGVEARAVHVAVPAHGAAVAVGAVGVGVVGVADAGRCRVTGSLTVAARADWIGVLLLAVDVFAAPARPPTFAHQVRAVAGARRMRSTRRTINVEATWLRELGDKD
eukprot:SAG25_NODE_315_length_9978_cov_10.651483_4_plen_187_part_00